MKARKSNRGFVVVDHMGYVKEKMCCLIGESSAIGDYVDSYNKPGSSFLWVGEHHHLNREEVSEMVDRMSQWLKTGRLSVD